MWPNILNMFGIGGANKGKAGGSSMPTKQNPLAFDDNALASGGWEKPRVQEKLDWGSLMDDQPQALKIRNSEPFIDPITGKPEIFRGNTSPIEAPQTPNTAGSEKAQMFGQFGDPKKAMGNIWDQIKGGAGKLKEGYQNLDKKMEENYKASGWAPEGYKSPYDAKEDSSEFTPGGRMTLDDIKSKEDVISQVDWQESQEGQDFLKHMRSGQRTGDYAVGNATMGGPFGGIMNSLFSKPWNYEVKSKHKYGSLK
jgi:hypothetical protein|tara:strand:+ start:597 stop:1355 length:759 start_codon:yes stop_codon:yes gene_type:complete